MLAVGRLPGSAEAQRQPLAVWLLGTHPDTHHQGESALPTGVRRVSRFAPPRRARAHRARLGRYSPRQTAGNSQWHDTSCTPYRSQCRWSASRSCRIERPTRGKSRCQSLRARTLCHPGMRCSACRHRYCCRHTSRILGYSCSRHRLSQLRGPSKVLVSKHDRHARAVRGAAPLPPVRRGDGYSPQSYITRHVSHPVESHARPSFTGTHVEDEAHQPHPCRGEPCDTHAASVVCDAQAGATHMSSGWYWDTAMHAAGHSLLSHGSFVPEVSMHLPVDRHQPQAGVAAAHA